MAGTLDSGLIHFLQIPRRRSSSNIRRSTSSFSPAKCFSQAPVPSSREVLTKNESASDRFWFHEKLTEGNPIEAFSLFRDDASRDPTSLGALAQASGRNRDIDTGRLVHRIVSSSESLMSDTVLTTRLLSMYFACGSPSQAQGLFEELPDRTVYHWNALISGYTRVEMWHEALTRFCMMLTTAGLCPDNFTLPCVIKTCGEMSDLDVGEVLHGFALKTGLIADVFVRNSLVSMYGRCDCVVKAIRVFDSMPERNLVSWNTLLMVISEKGFTRESFDVFNEMLLSGECMAPDDATIVTLLPICAAEGWVEMGKVIHGLSVKLSLAHEIRVCNALIDMYMKCRCFREAKLLFSSEIAQTNVVSWNSMIAGYAKEGNAHNTFVMLHSMALARIRVDELTILNALPVCSGPSELSALKELHCFAVKRNFLSKELVRNSIITAYAKCGQLTYAYNVFSLTNMKTVSTWNALMGGYAQNGNPVGSIILFKQMQCSGVEPDMFTIGSLLLACTHLGFCRGGMSIHGAITRRRLDDDPFLSVSLLSFYMQCGELSVAQTLFGSMNEKSLVSWNVMIAGLSQSSFADESLRLFRAMQSYGYQPSKIAVIGALAACSQVSTLRQGKELHCYTLKMRIADDAYIGSSLVDMYAKCGSIELSHKFFDQLKDKDVVSWNAMITGYGIHGFAYKAMKLFERMQREDVTPDEFTYMGLLMACSHAGLVERGLKYFREMQNKCKIEPKLEYYSSVVDMLGRAGRLADARRLIEDMPQKADSRMWGTLLSACRIYGDLRLGEKVAKKLLEMEPGKAEHYVLASNMFAASGHWEDVRSIRKSMKKLRLKKETGCSWIDINGKIYKFIAGDTWLSESRQMIEI